MKADCLESSNEPKKRDMKKNEKAKQRREKKEYYEKLKAAGELKKNILNNNETESVSNETEHFEDLFI